MNDFRNLQVWQKAHALALDVHVATASFPRDERFGLTCQLRRASASVAANIAESCGRGTRREEAQFLQIAFGSACEMEAEFLLASDLGYFDPAAGARLDEKITEVKRMLNALVRRTWARAARARSRLTAHG